MPRILKIARLNVLPVLRIHRCVLAVVVQKLHPIPRSVAEISSPFPLNTEPSKIAPPPIPAQLSGFAPEEM